MQEKHLFEYAVIRVVPRVEREEFVNAGVILYCASQRFLKVLYQLNDTKIHALCSETDIADLERYLQALEKICQGAKGSGTIGALPVASRFRWLTATRSSVVQSSKVHPGFCTDPQQTLEELFKNLVL
ncbi:DUF3037 domain-containing protein [Dyadobacter psychrotolerans]|uniref:DUF3037 domain-containing protein n=1 Tax=Dyadobacter psychrotolerans TaxID=2541721 RepID=A0A4V2Z2U9_9BACT|nr:DUF3037 domain-containing protein [Dyadobacter psychrotolerans]TDE10248.1 DUF3037 domain-containing protein [Dyadobacter psychrotolerans]